MSYVSLKSLTKKFDATLAVDHLSLDVPDGEFVSLLGPSGCGKTTTLRMIAGFIEPTAGTVEIGGKIFSDPHAGIFIPPEQRNLGMVFQSYAVWPHMNVYKNIAYPLKVRKTAKAEIKERVQRAAEQVKMPELLKRYPGQLSGGQQQRVALARALVAQPKVLLLDEPLSNLDAKLREEMRLEIKELQRRIGITIIFVTHDQVEAMVLSDRIAVMNKGKILQVGSPREIYENPADEFAARFIGAANLIPLEDGTSHAEGDPGFILPVCGKRGFAVIRPEDTEIRAEPGDGFFETRVETSMYLGDQVLCFLKRGDYRISVKLRRNTDPQPDDSVYLRITGSTVISMGDDR
ncbi:MAG: ABC transporter ATP-binding protein [Spirochaetia bacterium]